MELEIKEEPMDNPLINEEPPDAICPEFIGVSDDLLVASIKREHDAEEIYPELNIIYFNPFPVQEVAQPVRMISILKKQQHGNSLPSSQLRRTNENPTDLGEYCEPFQAKLSSNASNIQPEFNLSKIMIRHQLLRSICTGSVPLKLPPHHNAYFLQDYGDMSLLISRMSVEHGRPLMLNQIVVNAKLELFLYYGTRKITQLALCRREIKSAKSVELVAARFARFKWCRGLSPTVRIERWAPHVVFDGSSEDGHVFRHSKCKLAHRTRFDQCAHCKYLEARDRKFSLVKRQRYVTTTMLTNYKYWQDVKAGVRKMRGHVRRLKKENLRLRKKLKALEKGRGFGGNCHGDEANENNSNANV